MVMLMLLPELCGHAGAGPAQLPGFCHHFRSVVAPCWHNVRARLQKAPKAVLHDDFPSNQEIHVVGQEACALSLFNLFGWRVFKYSSLLFGEPPPLLSGGTQQNSMHDFERSPTDAKRRNRKKLYSNLFYSTILSCTVVHYGIRLFQNLEP